MPSYRIDLADGRSIRADAPTPEDAAEAADTWAKANPHQGQAEKVTGARASREDMSSLAYGKGYDAARARMERLGITKGGQERHGLLDQITAMTGLQDEANGAVNAGTQGVDNIIRRVQGKPIDSTMADSYHAAKDATLTAQEKFAHEHPAQNAFATVLGIAASGKPTNAPAAFAKTSPLVAGAQNAAMNAPFAVGRQEGDLPTRVKNALPEEAMAFGLGATLQAGSNAFSDMLAHPPKVTPQNTLADAGVRLTPGQMAGGAAKGAEDALTSVPILGDVIQSARRRGVQSFNVAMGNKVLAPIGETVPKNVQAGHDLVSYVGDRLSGAYEKLLPNMRVWTLDNEFLNDIRSLAPSLAELPENRQGQLLSIIDNKVSQPLQSGGVVGGDALKGIETKLGTLIRGYKRSGDVDAPAMASILTDAQQAVRRLVERQNPASADQLRAVNEGWAGLVRLEKAASSAGAHNAEGVFTPSQFNSAIRSAETTVRNRAVGRGEAMLQDFAGAAQKVLPSTLPDSGTAKRSIWAWVAAGGAAKINPPAAVGAALAMLPYTKAGQDVLNIFAKSSNPSRGALLAAGQRLQSLAARNPAIAPLAQQFAARLQSGGDQPMPQSVRTQSTTP